MYLSFQIKFPEANWTPIENLKVLEQVLPPRNPLPDLIGKECEDVVLSFVDPVQQQANARRHARDDMDEDEEHGGPGHVQCAQQ